MSTQRSIIIAGIIIAAAILLTNRYQIVASGSYNIVAILNNITGTPTVCKITTDEYRDPDHPLARRKGPPYYVCGTDIGEGR